MASCDNCRFVLDRNPEKREGWCHRPPPTLIGPNGASSWPGVYLGAWCGEHRWSIAGVFRALVALFRRK